MSEPSQTIIIEVTTDRVVCDGGGGALGHPRVYLELGADGRVVCPYCERVYVRADRKAG